MKKISPPEKILLETHRNNDVTNIQATKKAKYQIEKVKKLLFQRVHRKKW